VPTTQLYTSYVIMYRVTRREDMAMQPMQACDLI
jgi:hypothetical protein